MELKDNWTVMQTSKLIASYKIFPNLWDLNHKYYKNKALRKNCLRNIAKRMTQVKPGTTINDVRAKLKTLRSQYGKEKRRRDLIISKRGINDYQPKLWCYEELKFIDVERRTEEYISQDEGMEDKTLGDDAIAELLENNSNSDEEKNRSKFRLHRFPTWTKDQTFTLIRLLKQYPLIYDTTHPFYANPFQRTKAFRDILTKLKVCKPDVTIPEMRSKLKTLRSQYVKEKRMLKVSMERRGRVQYIPRLWCFEHLKFLDERGKFLEDEQDSSSASMQEREFEVGEQPDDCYVGENENEIYVKSFDDSDDEQMSMPTPVSENRQRNGQIPRSVLHQKCLSLVESLTKQMRREEESSENNLENSQTPQALLGKMVESELSNVSEEVFEDAKWKIIKLLEEASKRNRNSKLHNYLIGD